MANMNNYGGNRTLDNVTNIAGGSPDTGEMRRKYNFSEQFTELAIDQTPFFRMVSKIGTKPTDDPQFKYTEKRQSWMKRYGYCILSSDNISAGEDDGVALDADLDQDHKVFYMATDYLSQGNVQNIIGQDGTALGAAGTRPEFYLAGQIVKINYATGSVASGFSDFALYRVVSQKKGYTCHTKDTNSGDPEDGAVGGFWASETLDAGFDATKWYETVELLCEIVKEPAADSKFHMTYAAGPALITDMSPNSAYDNTIVEHLEPMRSYVVGTAHTEGSTLIEENWADQPYSTGFGYTQIFRNEFGMSNTARATALKYEKNEWARLWRDKLIEHKWEIEQTALFGKQQAASATNGSSQYTQGGVDYILSNGNLFTLTQATKTADSFLEDLSQLVDPRYNNSKKMLFFCDTSTYNWVHKLSGYFHNNLSIGNSTTDDSGGAMFTSSFAARGSKKLFGVDFTTISTVYGDINIARNIALDGSGVKIMGVNMDYVKWRHLVGNGVNSGTSVYVGVQTLENTGTDKRVDMILTEGGFEWSMPECHAIWK